MEVRARKDRKEQRLKREKEEAIRAKQLLWEQEKQKQQQSLVGIQVTANFTSNLFHDFNYLTFFELMLKANKIELKRLAEAEKKRQQV